VKVSPLVCSSCGERLQETAAALRCRNGHSFDIAREGYVNLLIPRDRERGIEGDSPDMLTARRRFLDRGSFCPLLDALLSRVQDTIEQRTARGKAPPALVVEAGCGEGYYIGSIAERIASAVCVGFDVSKAAARMAARRYPPATFAVANTRRRLYLETGSAAAVLNIFAPRNIREFARVIEPDGSLIIAFPDRDHFAGVRERFRLLDVREGKEADLLEEASGLFVPAARNAVKFAVAMDAAAVLDFIAMGPNAHHAATRSAQATDMTDEASVVVLTLRRSSA